MTKQQKILLSLVAIVAAIGGGLYFVNNSSTMSNGSTDATTSLNSNSGTNNSSPNNTNTSLGNTSASTDNGSVAITTAPSNARSDSATVSFQVPDNNTNTLTVNVTQDNGVITDISYSAATRDRESSQYYSSFVKSFKTSSVIGKKISDVSLSRVGGASLTTAAFMNALGNIAAKN